MRQAGIKLIGPGDVTVDNKLQGMGAAAVGIITMHHYNADLDNPENKRFVAAWKQEYGAQAIPDFTSVGGYDGMAAIVHVVQSLKGKIDTEKALGALKGWTFESPRGPITIDPATRDIVMNEYLSEVVMGRRRQAAPEADRPDRARQGPLQGAQDRALRGSDGRAAGGTSMQRTKPPFRADHVGSLLRPAAAQGRRAPNAPRARSAPPSSRRSKTARSSG